MTQNYIEIKIKRSHFTKEEDEKLKELVSMYGDDDWARISNEMNGRSTRQCRERWNNNLSPQIVKRKWTREEEAMLLNLVDKIGLKWKSMEQVFPGRTSISIKNRYNCLKRFNKLYHNNDLCILDSSNKKEIQVNNPLEQQDINYHLTEEIDYDGMYLDFNFDNDFVEDHF